MAFLIWHILAICTVIVVSFGIGYSVGKIIRKGKENESR